MALLFKQDSQILSDLGSRLRDLRLSHGYSQVELSAKAAVAKATVQRLEKSGQVSLESLLKILRVLGVHEAIENIATQQRFDPEAAFEAEQKTHKTKTIRRRVSRLRKKS